VPHLQAGNTSAQVRVQAGVSTCGQAVRCKHTGTGGSVGVAEREKAG
jgi:hypothetical protein